MNKMVADGSVHPGHTNALEERVSSVVVTPQFVRRIVVPLILAFSAVSLGANVVTVNGAVTGGTAELITRSFGVDREESLATLFQVLVIAACAASLFTVAAHERRTGNRRHLWWALLGGVFLALAVDEFASVHERLTDPVRDALDLGGALFFSWIVVAIPVVVVFAALLVPFLRSLPRRTFVLFMVAGALYLSGAVGFEMIGGAMAEASGSMETVLYVLVSTAEELFEMLGMATFLGAVGAYFAAHTSRP